MKQFLFLVETNKVASHIIYVNPPCQQFDNCFQQKPEDPEDVIAYAKEKLQSFLSQTDYFGMVNNNNLFGFSASFISDFFKPTKVAQAHEIIVDDLHFLTQSITLQNQSIKTSKDKTDGEQIQVIAFNLVLVLSRIDPQYVSYCKKSFIYLAKVLELDEQLRNYLSIQINKITDKSAQFEKKLHMIPVELEKQKANRLEVDNRLSEVKSLAKAATQSLELYQLFNNFCEALDGFQVIRINHFVQKLPNPDMILNPIAIEIKPYQTIVIMSQKMIPNVKSIRFQKFLTLMKPNFSFNDISICFNFPLREIQAYITHLQVHQEGIIINKYCQDSIFTLNTKFKFNMDKTTKKIADRFFLTNHFDLMCLISAFNKPSKESQIIQEIAGYKENIKCLFSLILQKMIQECEVYLYLKDPSQTVEKFRLALKQRGSSQIPLQMSSNTSSQITASQDEQQVIQQDSRSQDEKVDIQIMSHVINIYEGRNFTLNEISWRIRADIPQMWRFLMKYDDYIGYYYIL